MSGQETSPQSPPANTPKHRRPWNAAEDATLRTLVGHFGASRGSEGRWKDIAAGLEGRTAKECRKRWLHSLDPSLRKGRWTSQEDEILLSAYARLGPVWNDIANLIPGRKDDQCSKRYNDILNPSAKNRLSDWTADEDNLLRQGVATLGHRWVAISSRIPGRPPLTCRNRWRTLSRLSHQRQSKSQGTTPSSSSQMSPTDIGISPAPQNPNINLEANTGDHMMTFPTMDGDISHDQMGANFLDSAFFENFAGPSPSPLREASEDTETPNETTVPMNPATVPDIPSNVPEPPRNDSRTWHQPPRLLQPESQPQPQPQPQSQPVPNNTNGTFTMPSPSTWSQLGVMLPPGTSPGNPHLWMGDNGHPPAHMGVPGESSLPGVTGGDPIPQSYTEQFQLPTSAPQAIHHHHHHHVHHHFHHYHHYPGGGDQWRQLEQQCEADAMQSVQQNENGPPNAG